MKKFTKLMLTLAMLVLSVGGVNALTLNATFGTPAGNGSWDGANETYTWNAGNNNLMTIFSFSNGELPNYTSIHLTTSDYTDVYRICFMNGSQAVATIAFYSAGQKDINFAERDETKNLDLSSITHISFGGASGSGSIKLTNVYLEGTDPSTHEVFALGNPITFEQALTSTDPFVLVQNGKVLCGPLSATDNSLTYKDVSEIGDYAWTFKFEEDADNEGTYFMQLFNNNGNSKGYVNASVWSHTYLSGVNKENTKGELQNGALWKVELTTNGKYSIRNLGVSEGTYNNKPNEDGGDRTSQGFLAITTSGYWENHVTHYNTSGEWAFYTLATTQQTTNDPLYFGWDELAFSNDSKVTKDENTHFVRDARDYAAYWAETAGWYFNTPLDATGYKYLVFYTKRNATRFGNEDKDTGGSVFIKDNKGEKFQGDDYKIYRYQEEEEQKSKDYPEHTGSMWMNVWNEQRATVIDLEWLANTDKFGDASDCKSLDITQITGFGFSGDFTIGGAYLTNTLPNYSVGDYTRNFNAFDEYGTICLPYSAVCCGAQLYEITGKTSEGVNLTEHEGVMEAGKPYIYKSLEAKEQHWGNVYDETKIYFFKAGYAKANAPVENNGLIGTFSNLSDGEFVVVTDNQLKDGTEVGANQAYVDLTKISGNSGSTLLAYNTAPTVWQDLVINGNMEVTDNSCFVRTQQGEGGPWLAPIEDGCVKVMSANIATNPWDTQFFIKLTKVVPNGTKFKFSIDYKADNEAEISTQAHIAPSSYNGGEGSIGSFTYSSSDEGWKTFEKEGTLNGNNEGTYTIAFNLSANKKETTFYFKNISFMVTEDAYNNMEDAPEAPARPVPAITVGEHKYATVSFPYSVSINSYDVKAYCITYTDGVVKFGEEVNALPANNAVLVAAGNAGTFSNGIETARVLDDVATGLSAASNDASNPTKGDGSTIYVLANGSKGVGFYLLKADDNVPAGKGYLKIEGAASREFIGLSNDATTIKAIEELNESGLIYNLAGQQVKNAQKGVFILNGKKVIK